MRGTDAAARRGVGGKMSWKNKVYHARDRRYLQRRVEERRNGRTEDESGGCFGSVSGCVGWFAAGGEDGRSVRKSEREEREERQRERERGEGEKSRG